MQPLLRRFGDYNLAALGVLALLFAALGAGGANSAGAAALLACALSLCLLIAAIAAPAGALDQTLRANGLAILAALAFIALALLSATGPFAVFAPHPRFDEPALARASLSPYRTLEGVGAFLGPCAAYLLGALAAPNARARDQVGRWTMALGFLYGMFALYLFFSGAQVGPRLDVAIGSANAAATVFGMLMVAGAVMATRAARGRLSGQAQTRLPAALTWARFAYGAPLSLAASFVLFACLLLTASRGGLIATLAALAVYAALLAPQLLKSQRMRQGATAAPVLVMCGALALMFARGGEDVLARFALSQADAEVRATLASAHWSMFLERPLLGHGLNTYHELNTLAQTPDNWRALFAAGSAHNIFIQALEETGLIGLGLLALMLAVPLARALMRLIAGGRGVEWAAGALGLTTLVLLHGLVDFGLQTPAVAALYAFLIGAAAGRPAGRA